MLWQFQLLGKNLNVPIVFDGDTMHFLAAAQAMLDSAPFLETDRLSAPFSYPILEFPADGALGRLLMAAVSRFTRTPGMTVNFVYFLNLFIAGNLMAWSLRQLRAAPEAAFTAGLLYALLPYHQMVCTIHLMTLAVLAPPVLAWSVLLADPDTLASLKRKRVLLAFTASAGLMSIYPAFFAGCTLAAGTLSGWLASRDRRSLKFGVLALILLLAAFALGNLPALLYWASDPQTFLLLDNMKSPAEADGAPPLLRHILVPPPSHPFPPFAALGRQLASAALPLDAGETRHMAWSGTLTTFGFCFLTAILCGFLPARLEPSKRLFRQAASIMLGLMLIAFAGGLGSIWNAFASAQIRAYVRFVPYFAGLCLPVAVILLVRASPLRWVNLAAAAALSLLATVDQSATRYFPAMYAADARKFLDLSALVAQMESRYPQGSSVFQLPWTPYPSTPPLHAMRADEHMAAFVVSKSLKWSWPAFSAQSTRWQQHASRLTGAPLCDRLALARFSALWIDRRGYPDGAAVIMAELQPLLGPPVLASRDGHIVVYDLAQHGLSLRSRLSPGQWTAASQEALLLFYRWGKPVPFDGSDGTDSFAFPLKGLSSPEQNLFTWTSAKSAWFAFEVATPASGDVRLDLKTMPFGTIVDRFRLQISVDSCSSGQWTLARGPESYSFTLPASCIAGKKSFVLKFTLPDSTSPLQLGQGPDTRRLGIALRALVLSPVDPPPTQAN